MAYEAARIAEQGQETGPRGEIAMRVVALNGKGGSASLHDLIAIPGMDMAIVPALSLEKAKKSGVVPVRPDRIVSVAVLHVAEVHLLASGAIRSAADLAGKKVAVGEIGSTDADVADALFDALGIKPDLLNRDTASAKDALSKGELDAVVIVTGKGADTVRSYEGSAGIRLLPLESPALLEKGFLPVTLTPEDYPGLVKEDVDSVGVTMVLAAYDWPKGSSRRSLTASFVRSLFSKFAALRDGHPGKWQEVNLAASSPGWTRYAPADEWLARNLSGQGRNPGAPK